MLSEERIARIYGFYLETTLFELLNWKKAPLELFNFHYLQVIEKDPTEIHRKHSVFKDVFSYIQSTTWSFSLGKNCKESYVSLLIPSNNHTTLSYSYITNMSRYNYSMSHSVAWPDPGLLGPVPYHQLSRPYHHQLSKNHMILCWIRQENRYITQSYCNTRISVCIQYLYIDKHFITYKICQAIEYLQNLLEC